MRQRRIVSTYSIKGVVSFIYLFIRPVYLGISYCYMTKKPEKIKKLLFTVQIAFLRA